MCRKQSTDFCSLFWGILCLYPGTTPPSNKMTIFSKLERDNLLLLYNKYLSGPNSSDTVQSSNTKMEKTESNISIHWCQPFHFLGEFVVEGASRI